MMILQHARHMQVFDEDDRRGFRQRRGRLLEGVRSLIAYLPVCVPNLRAAVVRLWLPFGLRVAARCISTPLSAGKPSPAEKIADYAWGCKGGGAATHTTV